MANQLVMVYNGGLREDQGLDGTAYKEALEQHITWNRILEFDELLLINDSCYGSFLDMLIVVLIHPL